MAVKDNVVPSDCIEGAQSCSTAALGHSLCVQYICTVCTVYMYVSDYCANSSPKRFKGPDISVVNIVVKPRRAKAFPFPLPLSFFLFFSARTVHLFLSDLCVLALRPEN